MTDDQDREDVLGSESEGSSSKESDASGLMNSGSSGSASQERADSEMQEPSERAVEEEATGEVPGDMASEAGEPAEVAEAEKEPPEPSKVPESRFGRFLKRALRWIVFLLVVFALGVLAMQFIRVQPQRQEIAALNQSLEAAETVQAELELELNRLEGVEAENEELRESLLEAEATFAILEIRLDVAQAQLALALGDTASVAAALQDTGEALNDLRNMLGASKAADVEALRERLVLVLSEVDSDPFAAERDLEILANTLQEMEREVSRP